MGAQMLHTAARVLLALLIAVAVATGTSALVASCDESTGRYPLPPADCSECGGDH